MYKMWRCVKKPQNIIIIKGLYFLSCFYEVVYYRKNDQDIKMFSQRQISWFGKFTKELHYRHSPNYVKVAMVYGSN